jgi:hypothetical protein
MTVGGITKGMAVMASIAGLSLLLLWANHQARGVAKSSNIRVVMDASLSVSQMAVSSTEYVR